jgi:hypothetical protein
MDIADKVEGFIDKNAGAIGAGLAAATGVWKGISSQAGVQGDPAGYENYFTRIIGGKLKDGTVVDAEFMHLTNLNMADQWNVINYLKYKFGLTKGQAGETSAWATPFWASLIGYILSKTGVLPARYNKPLANITKAAAITSGLGALFLPGSSFGPGSAKASASDIGDRRSTPAISTLRNYNINQPIGGAF